jgi:hypothetical protein
MLTVILGDGRLISIEFKHDRRWTEVPGSDDLKKRNMTSCTLHVLTRHDLGSPYDGTLLASGLMAHNPSLPYVKEVGRKWALRRALAEAKLSHDDRERVWNCYFTRGLHTDPRHTHVEVDEVEINEIINRNVVG